MHKRSDTLGAGSLRSGGLTAISLFLVSAASAVIGVVIAREFGRTEQTDGLLAAYGIFLVVVVAAQAIRVAVLPQLARAMDAGRLAGELAGYAIALVLISTPSIVVAELWADPLSRLLTGDESAVAAETAEYVLRWLVVAGVMQLFAALAASGLAALDSYGIAAAGYAGGSAAGLVVIVARVEPDGVRAIAWGVTLSALIAVLVPTIALAVRASRARMPRKAARPSGLPFRDRTRAFGVAATLPIALQLLYVVSLPFAAELGTGATTTFVYGYLAASSIVAVTAGSLGLVTAVPLARGRLTVEEMTRHLVSASWIALVGVGAAAGVFAVAGGVFVRAVLGASYGGEVGADLGRLVVALSPWMVASVAVTLAFPLTFVAGRTRRLPWIAVGALALQLPLSWIGVALLDLYGLALALACSTAVVLLALLTALGALTGTARGIALAGAIVGGLTLASFLPPSLLLDATATAVVGLVLYGGLLLVLRPRALTGSWEYLRALR
ncbi:MAG TPA: hypothetical protein VMK83_00740 [Gaiellaceae bacterium]|nr:hypothetical protein [Gaiellaceae bacterium]